MKIGILQTGAPPEALQPRFGGYPSMFEALLPAPDLTFETLVTSDGVLPEAVEDFDAYLITGSSAGVYDDAPWIAPLKDFLRAAKGRATLVGVCFGHQIMAEAFGGKVIQSPKGWGVGLQTYEVRAQAPWMDDAQVVRAPASHQDQVVEQPPSTTLLAASDFTPFAALAYQDQPAVSFQFHPEFDPAYAKALIESRRGSRFTDAQADAALASLDSPNDRARVGDWITRFLRANAPSA